MHCRDFYGQLEVSATLPYAVWCKAVTDSENAIPFTQPGVSKGRVVMSGEVKRVVSDPGLPVQNV